VIPVQGRQWGTAAELAEALGPDVTEAMVRRWRERDGLTAVEVGRKVLSPLDQTARIERDKRLSGTGRPRRLDTAADAA
jgi:hypothetical protein